jgi:hypothetical protein
MVLKEMTSNFRNDFKGILVCEHCGHEADLKNGYSDDFYFRHVIPSMLCKDCGLNRSGTKTPTCETVGVQTL